MKRFTGFVIKEISHILRDFRTLLILFALPGIQLLIFGFVVTNELKDIRVAVMDHSRDRYSRDITGRIMASEYFIFDGYIEQISQIDEKFREGRVKQIIVFEPGFGEKLVRERQADIQLLADASDANTASLVVNYTSAIIQETLMEQDIELGVKMQIVPEVRMVYNQSMKGAYMFVPGTMALILMIVSALMTSISITREKETGTMEALLVSPLKPLQIVLGKVTPYVGLSFINTVTIIALGYFVFGLPVVGSLSLLMLECLLFISVALALGIFISTMAETQQIAMFMSMMILLLPTILLSGFIFPVENMPFVLQLLSYIFPAKYFIVVVKSIMLKGAGFSLIWKETIVMLGMLLFLLVISIGRLKTRLE
jgi:ABC-2 type transport system permease protein